MVGRLTFVNLDEMSTYHLRHLQTSSLFGFSSRNICSVVRNKFSGIVAPYRTGRSVRGGLAGAEWTSGPVGQPTLPAEGQRLDKFWMWHLNQEVEPAAAVNPEHQSMDNAGAAVNKSGVSCELAVSQHELV